MALKKSDLRKILNNEEATVDERISEILDILHEEVDTVKDERDELKEQLKAAKENEGNDGEWQKKYDKLKEDFDSYKTEQTRREDKQKKESALSEMLKDSELSEKGQRLAKKYTNLDDLELDDSGKIKGAVELMKSLSEEWADYIVTDEKKADHTKDKDGANGKHSDGMTKAEIMKIKDAKERQQAIAEHHELFNF